LDLSSALEYLVGEKLLRFVEAAEHYSKFARELLYFVAEIKRVFSLAEVGNYAAILIVPSRVPARLHTRNFINIRANPLDSTFGSRTKRATVAFSAF
jgi:hypothetical protein